MATAIFDSQIRRKLALIIGNSAYSRSPNRINDSIINADRLARQLENIDFKVFKLHNGDSEDLLNAFTALRKKIREGDIVLFYYAGHACQIDNKNYLIPTDDAQIDSYRDVENFGLNIGANLNRFWEKNRPHAVFIVLDCNGTYSFKETQRSGSSTFKRGLQKMTPPSGSLIQFSCDANTVVDDNSMNGQTNLFLKHLLKHIDAKNRDIRDIFRSIVDGVYQESDHRQRPLTMDGLAKTQQVHINYVFEPEPEPPKLSIEQFLSAEPLSTDERQYFEECKEYHRLTQQPLISIPNEIYDHDTKQSSLVLKLGVDENLNAFNLDEFWNQFCPKLGFSNDDLSIKRIQKGSAIVEVEINNKLQNSSTKLKIKMICQSFTEKLKMELGRMKLFFMYMGPLQCLDKIQKFRTEIKMNPKYNHLYLKEHNFWSGALVDGRDRGGKPYYCPVGWKRWSFYMSENFYEKFKGWAICYHGTKFQHGLSILLGGLKPATQAVHGAGIYATPSINYACHPRYAEVKEIVSSTKSYFFPVGRYVQFVLECRVHPKSILKIRRETLNASQANIDVNISNAEIEWLINHQNKDLVDFDDPDASIVCTGIMVRITDDHPGLLNESRWWYKAHLCSFEKCCMLGIPLKDLEGKLEYQNSCRIVYD